MTNPATGASPLHKDQAPAETQRPTSTFRKLLRQRRAQFGMVLTAVILLIAFLGPLFAPHGYSEFVGAPYLAHAPGTVFGTDNLGRDVLSRFLFGGWQLILIALVTSVLGVALGAAIGMWAGYRGGWIDELLMRGSDVVLAFPQVVAALLFLSIIGPQLWLIIVLVIVTHAPRVARVIRGATLNVVERDFIKAAESANVPTWKIALTEILPNVNSSLMVEVGLRLTYSIGVISALSFLGLGMQPPAADWGLMINENRVAMTVQPWGILLPVLAIGLLTIGTNFITDGLARVSLGAENGIEK
ncbi:ABC transporter permease [Micrococcales bacterium 31B]|nr:ABC transporter permease [Micrococcales bacterium 31B]